MTPKCLSNSAALASEASDQASEGLDQASEASDQASEASDQASEAPDQASEGLDQESIKRHKISRNRAELCRAIPERSTQLDVLKFLLSMADPLIRQTPLLARKEIAMKCNIQLSAAEISIQKLLKKNIINSSERNFLVRRAVQNM
jgi:hypothetical protein